MSVLCGWASQSEHKTANGVKGDQTGGEVKTGDWYDFGQSINLRWKNAALGRKAAAYWKAICKCSKIGYGQDDRTSADTELRKVDYMVADLKKNVNLDCSSGMALVVRAMLRKIDPDHMPPATCWTGNLRKKLIDTGYFVTFIGGVYGIKRPDYVRAGDILLNPSKHVIMVLEDSPATIAYDAKKKSKAKAFYTGTVAPEEGLNVRSKPSTKGKITGALPKGTKVSCYGVAQGSGMTWWKISATAKKYVAAKYLKDKKAK